MKRKWFQLAMLLVIASFLIGVGPDSIANAASSSSTVSTISTDFDFKESEFNAPKTGFNYYFNKLLSSHTPHHNGYDLVVNDKDPQVIKGKFQYGDLRKDLEGEWVSIYSYSLSGGKAGWHKLGRAKTNRDGRISFTIPAENHLPQGIHLIKLYVEGDGTHANMYLYNLANPSKTVVFDIDGTLTTDDCENIKEYLNELWDGNYKAKMYQDADKVARYYADQGYHIVYLTARPYWLTEKSQTWLMEHGFPRGILHTYDGDKLLVGDKTTRYKRDFLQDIGSKGMALETAYGNASTDIDAYLSYGLTGNHIYIIGKNAGSKGTTPLKNYTDHLNGLIH
ncbi:LNS2 domain-containing protein [Marininema halotolerans]|uniref:LNS2 (Lipin/Ned1/Smp2) n=1 Tax=Marininema halotolerans TaxID=1155944 RepID=A0A1I6R8I2_9BACL|nr:HAD family acid phosphatase [Marininema halotolerans]SFS61037.1 LNS2 (Lipin/Ned1/Smp2) [Marininema halotolerans]